MRQPQPMPGGMSGMQPPARAETPAARYAGPAAGGPMPDEPTVEPTPQEQRAYTMIVENAGRVIHDAKFSDALAKQLTGGGDPAPVMGQAVATVVTRVATEMAKRAGPPPPDVLVRATEEVYELVYEIAERIGAVSDDEQAMARGWLEAADATRVALMQAGVITQEQAQADVAEMKAADAGGMPGMDVAPAAKPKGGGFGGMMGAV